MVSLSVTVRNLKNDPIVVLGVDVPAGYIRAVSPARSCDYDELVRLYTNGDIDILVTGTDSSSNIDDVMRMNFEIAKSGVMLGQAKQPPVFGANILSNAGFEDWAMLPDSWSTQPPWYPVRTADAHSGSYAAQFAGGGCGGDWFLNASLLNWGGGFTPSDEYILKVWAKKGAVGGGDLRVIFLSFGMAGVSFWNFVTLSWDVAVPPYLPLPDHMYCINATASYVEYTLPKVAISADANIAIYLGSDCDTIIDDVSFKKDGTGPEQLPNPSFETWSPSDIFPMDWEPFWSGPTATVNKETTKVHSGAASCHLHVEGPYDMAAVMQLRTSLTPGAYYRPSVWARNDGDGSFAMVLGSRRIFDADPIPLQCWNWAQGKWETVPNPQTDHLLEFSPTTEYQQFIAPIVPIPASGKIQLGFMRWGNTVANDIYLDDAMLQATSVGENVALFDFANPSDTMNLVNGDYVFKMRTTGGTPKTFFSQAVGGQFETDFDVFDFTSKPMRISTAWPGGNPANAIAYEFFKGWAIQQIGAIWGADLKNIGPYDLPYDWGFGKVIPIGLLFVAMDVRSVTGQPEVSFGVTGPDYNDVVASIVLDLDATDKFTFWEWPKNNEPLLGGGGGASQELYMKVQTLAVAAAYSVNVYLIGKWR